MSTPKFIGIVACVVVALGSFIYWAATYEPSEWTTRKASAAMYEDGKVEKLFYIPATHRVDTVYRPEYDWYNDEWEWEWKDIIVEVPAKYGVLFTCDHGSFTLEGTKNAERMWKTLKEGDEVTITYKEIYNVHHRRVEGAEKQVIVTPHLVDYDFLNAKRKE